MFWRKKRLPYELQQPFQLDTKLRDLSFTVFDTETTGFSIASRDRLIEIGAVHVEGFYVTDRVFQTFVNPDRDIPEHITKLTSISQRDVEGAPSSLEAIEAYFQFVEANQSGGWVGHHISFDEMVLKNELHREKLTFDPPSSFDTMDLINHLNPTWDQQDLENYATVFGSRTFERHRALGDALTTAHLFVEVLRCLEERGITTLADLLRLRHGKSQQSIALF
ncbi:exonuclease domain-containing protein [Sporosarcina sp. FSL W7-1349]|uniref:3'-5' exonuclease n=1 Tax=Sporosarcina sp. FSL W7-1349 TaxID=2921561 RepID=UPI0030F71DA4